MNSTTVARSYIVITICTPLTWVGVCVHEMVSMSYLLVIFVESSSVTCYRAVGNSVGGRKVLYRTRIHVDAAQISYKCRFGVVAATVNMTMYLLGVGASWCREARSRSIRVM